MTGNRTTETITDRLCALLDERGVEHYDGTESTLWLKDEHGYRASADELSSGRLSVHIWCDTPEQAIAATLGSGTCKVVKTEERVYGGEGADTYEHVLSCGHVIETFDEVPPNYCPNCGARIRKKVAE